jgi:exopolysaccharide biosynthesis polyprenyl glycosylphosphotransferase
MHLDLAGAATQRPVGAAERGGFWKDALRRRMLATADLLAVIAAALAAGLAHNGTATTLWTASLAPAWLVLAKLRGLYDRDHVRLRHQTLDESSALFHWVALCCTGTALVLVALPGDLLTPGAALAMAATAFCLAFLLRSAARALWRRLVPPERGLIVGSGTLAADFARKLALESGHHLVLAGHVGLTSEQGSPNGVHGERRVVTLEEWGSLVVTERIERVIVALRDLDEETLSRVASDCRSLGVKLSVAPPLRAMLGTAVDLHHLAELPLIEFRTWDPSRSTELLKHTMDVVGASVAAVALFPWLLLIALAIKLDSRGPALFRQTRAGRNGDPFEMLKFRTMVADAPDRLHEFVDVDRLSEPAFKLRSDPRITRVGRFLRRMSLDELPQLINVLRGEMSLVGPRPEEVWLVDRYGEADRFRLEMRPGMTGPMQVHGRGELSFQERMSVEREYVENYSLRKDVKILFQTLAAVATGRGAY